MRGSVRWVGNSWVSGANSGGDKGRAAVVGVRVRVGVNTKRVLSRRRQEGDRRVTGRQQEGDRRATGGRHDGDRGVTGG